MWRRLNSTALMNSSVKCILQGTKSLGIESQVAIQNYFSAQFSVCKAVNYLHLLSLFKHLNSMNGVQAHFKNIESLRNPAAGNSCCFPLQAASPPGLLLQFLQHHVIRLNIFFSAIYYFAHFQRSAVGLKLCTLRTAPFILCSSKVGVFSG